MAHIRLRLLPTFDLEGGKSLQVRICSSDGESQRVRELSFDEEKLASLSTPDPKEGYCGSHQLPKPQPFDSSDSHGQNDCMLNYSADAGCLTVFVTRVPSPGGRTKVDGAAQLSVSISDHTPRLEDWTGQS